MKRPIAVVTGGNRGLGRETCRRLGAAGYEVLLASRREPEGRSAAEALAREGLAVAWRPLDVGDPASIAAFAKKLTAEAIAIDALVNNAGVYHEQLDGRTAHETINVNFHGPLRLTEALAPLLAPHARVVMVSSGMGELVGLPAAMRSRFEVPLDLDALVNNAGVYHEQLDGRTAHETINVNFHGPLRLTGALAPLLAPHARVVMVSSGMGELVGLPAAMRSRFEVPLDLDALTRLEVAFVAEVERGEHAHEGVALSYRVSKCGLNVLTRLLARALAARGVVVNAVCPGWVRTDMGGAGATRGIPEGAAGIVWAATLPPGGPTGGFFRDGRPIAW
jgi:NAD(P)-dependent dehydrogenase (short-subunit alcohol dehydrogenase family)